MRSNILYFFITSVNASYASLAALIAALDAGYSIVPIALIRSFALSAVA